MILLLTVPCQDKKSLKLWHNQKRTLQPKASVVKWQFCVPSPQIRRQNFCIQNAGDEISYAFEGTGVSIVGNWFKDCGKADVFVDGQFKRKVDCYYYASKQEQSNMDLYHIFNLPQGKHTIKLVVKGEKKPESEGTNVYVVNAVVYKTGNKANENYKFSFQK